MLITIGAMLMGVALCRWIAGKLSVLLGTEDDVVIELCFNLLEGARFVCQLKLHSLIRLLDTIADNPRLLA
jgi:hypothetical protein